MTRKAVEWVGETDGELRLIDQTLLPRDCQILTCHTVEQVSAAIKRLAVRGAPAIGVAAAYGVILGIREATVHGRSEFRDRLREVVDYLAGSRPTAVNLFWALRRMQTVAEALGTAPPPAQVVQRLLTEAKTIEAEDRSMCEAIGRHGATLMPDKGGVLTHCNTGFLATAGDGTALAAIFAATAMGKQLHVYADETRPLLQGARLTAWELMERHIPVTLICDSMAGWVMRERRVHAVIVGADRIAANGDAANKIGTYSLSVLAKAHGIPFYVAAPSSTFDLSLASGDLIPIEERTSSEITHPGGVQFAPDDCAVFNPAFDVAPAENITALVTERGVISPVNRDTISRVLQSEG